MNEQIAERLVKAIKECPDFRILALQSNVPPKAGETAYEVFDIHIAYNQKQIWLWCFPPTFN